VRPRSASSASNSATRAIQTQPKVYALDGQDKLRIRVELPGASERIGMAQSVLVALGGRVEG